MWGTMTTAFNANRAVFIAGLLAVVVLAAFITGWKVESWRWDAAEKKQVQKALELQLESQKKILALQQVADNTQQGAVTAVKGIYEYYSNHPNVKYLGNDFGCLQQYDASQALPYTTNTTNSDNATPTNNGHVTTGTSEEVQVIQPNLLARCAETTLQALACREYVVNITNLINKE